MNEKKSNHNLTIGVEADTTTLTKKLRAIAKHAEALANELESIDAWKCPKCEWDEYTTIYHDDTKVSSFCTNCREPLKEDAK